MEINNKFKIGNVVQVYEVLEKITVKGKCPLCKGKHSVKNPSSHYLLNNKEILECPFCDVEGNIPLKCEKERRLSSTIYRVVGIEFYSLEEKISIFYRLEPLDEYNINIILRPERDLEIAQ